MPEMPSARCARVTEGSVRRGGANGVTVAASTIRRSGDVPATPSAAATSTPHPMATHIGAIDITTAALTPVKVITAPSQIARCFTRS